MLIKHLIDGEFVDGESKETIPLTNPATQEVIAQIPLASNQEINTAVESAQKAFYKWKETQTKRQQ